MKDTKKNSVISSRVAISWVWQENSITLVAYDTATNRLIYWLIDYCLYLSTVASLNVKTVQNEILYVKRFVEFMLDTGIGLNEIRDEVLIAFRDQEFHRVKKKNNWSGSEKAASRTVNAKLRRIYHFLDWLQSVEGLSIDLIGSRGCRVRSSLGDPGTASLKEGGRRRRYSDRKLYPLLFRQVGERSKHRTKYVATDVDVDELVQYFLEHHPGALAHRNILIMEIANRIGLRRASINSLRCDQFSRDAIERSKENFSVVPDSQKFGYEARYEVPFRLAYRICEYIENVRASLMAERGWSEKQAMGRVFFSFRNGKPLTDRSISQIFGRALDMLGIKEHGANIHSLRRKFANDRIDEEHLIRRSLGLDTSVSSIAASVSLAMGQSNPESLMPYVSRAQGKFRPNIEKVDSERIADLELENQSLKIQLAEANEELRLREAKKRSR